MSLWPTCGCVFLISLLLTVEGRPDGTDGLTNDEKTKEKACFAKFPLPEASRNKFLDEGFLINESEEKELCYANCILMETFLTENGVIRPDLMVSQQAANSTATPERAAKVEKAKTAIKTCITQAADATGCNKNYKIWRCFDKLVIEDDDDDRK